MTFALDPNTIVQALLIAAMTHTARVLFRTSTVVERLDERTAQHEKRIEKLEDRAA
jgi:cell division protein FtsB